jgi:Ala-tRNA(Pro) deacylase
MRKGDGEMLDAIVRYLHDSLTPFRLASYPSAEHLPGAAHPLPPHGLLVESQLVLAAGQLIIACYPATETIDLAALGNALGAPVLEPTAQDMPPLLQSLGGHPPALGQLFGFPIVVDEAVTGCAVIVFQAFGKNDYIEIPYEDFSRQERPRVASFTRAGELPREAAEGMSPSR